MKMKDYMKNLGKEIDKAMVGAKEKGKEAAKSAAKAAAKKAATGAVNTTKAIGNGIQSQIKSGAESIKEKLEIKDEMTAGEKVGKVVEKTVNGIGTVLGKLSDKIKEHEAKKFASPAELRVQGYDILIGEDIGAVTTGRATACRAFFQILQKDKKHLPYKLKDYRKQILEEVIRSASVTTDELLQYLLNKDIPEALAAIKFLEKEIEIVKKIGGKND